jgi:hypothetical protein
MNQIHLPPGAVSSFWIVVRSEPSGQFTARAVGISELHATAATHEEAVRQVRDRLREWLNAGQLVSVEVPWENPLLRWFGHADPNDPSEQAYLEELARQKAEDLERTLREYEQENQQCSSSSSTPTT